MRTTSRPTEHMRTPWLFCMVISTYYGPYNTSLCRTESSAIALPLTWSRTRWTLQDGGRRLNNESLFPLKVFLYRLEFYLFKTFIRGLPRSATMDFEFRLSFSRTGSSICRDVQTPSDRPTSSEAFWRRSKDFRIWPFKFMPEWTRRRVEKDREVSTCGGGFVTCCPLLSQQESCNRGAVIMP